MSKGMLARGPLDMASITCPVVTRTGLAKSEYIEELDMCAVGQKSILHPSPAEMPKSRVTWTFSAIFSLCLVLLSWPVVLTSRAKAPPEILSRNSLADPPRQSNNLTNVVQWDNYTLFVNDQRILLYSGEFHAFRLPVPDLWLDIFQKMKAAGLNGVSIYTHWGLSNPAPGVLDFNDWRDLQPLFDAAKEAGIFIVLRPGPYINAETTAGGIAHWVTSQVAGELRTNASDFKAAWTPYIQAIIKAAVPNQITNGGPIIAVQIDNEYTQNPPPRAEYFAQLEEAYRSGGVVVPLTYNDPNMGKNFINGTGAVDIYGMDSYPQLFDCSNPETWNPVVPNYHQYHEASNPNQPWYMPEFQGGSFDPWAGPGYDACAVLTGPQFQDVFYKQNWASNAKLMSFYMLYGGTSWGGLPFPGVYTSYDYGASIRENRALSDKFDELKRQGLFLRSSPEFRKTDWIGDSSTGGVSVNGSGAFVTFLRNPDSGAGFYIARQNDSTSTAKTDFRITVETSAGTVTLPQTLDSIVLDGRQSKVLVTDYAFGASRLLYSTAGIFFAGTIGSRDVLYLFGDSTQSHEAALLLVGTSTVKATTSNVTISTDSNSKMSTITVLPGVAGLVTVWESDTQMVLYSDSVTAATFWAPVIPGSSALAHYWQFGSNETVLVGGPYLVRNATINNQELALTGDLNASVPLTVIAPNNVRTVSWNGVVIPQDSGATGETSIFQGRLDRKLTSNAVHIPTLSKWKFADSLPEIHPTFDDASWITANHTSTNSISPPLYGDGRVLYGCDYGFCENIVLWRGHFSASGDETSVNLSITGGSAFAASVWINDVFIKSTSGNSSTPMTDEVYNFPPGSVVTGKDNVITIIQDNMGLDESSLTAEQSKSPRGISGFKLNNGNFKIWKVQGKLGGYTDYPDKTRGILNEGGLFGERQGWHLPGFDTSHWQTRALADGLPNGSAGVGFFVTTFNLQVPSGTDVPMSFVFDQHSQPFRALLFVNGWNYGKRVGNLGPQVKFPVHQGLLNYNGNNTVAVALWGLEANATLTPKLSLVADGFIDGGVGPIATNNPGWSPRNSG
ncbi:glycoside hydrolase superfamily [Gautieria morchelliformis]|nr:glycoside hydrolase superfamily [Gautieria morchelliformis]